MLSAIRSVWIPCLNKGAMSSGGLNAAEFWWQQGPRKSIELGGDP
jgi:hypothetical protein